MCIVVDTNAFKKVFSPMNIEHENFKPVFDWIMKGKGKLIIGGPDYTKEILEKMPNNSRLLKELGNTRRIHHLNDEKVDLEQKRVKTIYPGDEFDDPHIVAMCIVSKCCVVCTGDIRSHKFLRMKSLYPKRHKLPSIYSGSRNSNLLNNDALKPCIKK